MSKAELEGLVRAFLEAWREWQISANAKDEAGRAEAERHEAAGDEDWDYDATTGEIAADYRAFLAPFVTERILSEDVGTAWEYPARDRVSTMEVVEVEERRTKAVVRTLEIDHRLLPPEGYEYIFKRVDGRWRLDDRRTRGLDGRWIHRVF